VHVLPALLDPEDPGENDDLDGGENDQAEGAGPEVELIKEAEPEEGYDL